MAGQGGLYSKLVALPLFMGMSQEELHEVVSVTKFEFMKYTAGEVVAQEGDLCGRLLLLVDGMLEVVTPADDHSYMVYETSGAPAVLQPECAFGFSQRFTRTFTARSSCSLISIEKKEILTLTDNSLIFRLNLLNLISTALQKRQRDVWHSVPHDLNQRICRFFVTHCMHPAGHKVFKMKMTRLAAELNANRLQVSRALNAMQDARLLTLRRGIIEIDSLEKLLAVYD
jgi:CRP-like cAMP-binding protein